MVLLVLVRVSGHEQRCFLEGSYFSGFMFWFYFVMIFIRLAELEEIISSSGCFFVESWNGLGWKEA